MSARRTLASLAAALLALASLAAAARPGDAEFWRPRSPSLQRVLAQEQVLAQARGLLCLHEAGAGTEAQRACAGPVKPLTQAAAPPPPAEALDLMCLHRASVGPHPTRCMG